MTARTAPSGRGRRPRRGRLPTVLFWVGAMLAPLAGIALWFARDGGELRGTAVLAILGTVLIGLSVVLRRDAEGVRLELQENLAAEIEAVRGDLGSAITTALQRTKHSTHAELAALQEQLDTLAARLGADAQQPVAASAAQALRVPQSNGPRPPRRRDPVADSMNPGTIDPVRDSGEQRFEPFGVQRRPQPEPRRQPRAIDPLRDSVSRLDPWAELRGGDASSAAPEPRTSRRARHRAED